MMVSWIWEVEGKCVDSVCNLTKDSTGHPDGVDMRSEENGGMKGIRFFE